MSDNQRGPAGRRTGWRARNLLVPILFIGLAAIIPLRLTTHRSPSVIPSAGGKDQVARVEAGLKRVVLTEKAAERLGIETAAVREVPLVRTRPGEVAALSPAQRKVIPYAAMLYDVQGKTWVYTNPEPLVFVRDRIHIDYIDGDLAVLSEGPPPGTKVVTVGAAELFGAELGIGK